MNKSALQKMRDAAYQHYLAGDFKKAIDKQIEIINHKGNKDNFEDKHILSLYLYQFGDLPAVVTLLEHLLNERPGETDILKNLGMCLIKTGKYQQADTVLQQALARNDNNADIHDALAHLYGIRGDVEKTIEHGNRSLHLKDLQSTAEREPFPLPDSPPQPFVPGDDSRNIISFSLWGNRKRYTDGALKNAMLVKDIYPGWRCRFYHDSTVPETVINELSGYGAETMLMPPQGAIFSGLFWRFSVANDKSVARFLVRDCDSVINMKERAAVDEWLMSDRYFHIMRDYYTHTELILAGMWGGVGNVLPPIERLAKGMPVNILRNRTVDQLFLRIFLWPTIKQSCMVHDSVFSIGESRNFPYPGLLPPDRHVGQDYSVL